MTIPESQLDTWSHQGSVTQSASTYATIKLALENSDAGYADKAYSIFLQGSYGNDTNIYAESDVDVVMKLTSLFYYDICALSAEDQQRFHSGTGGPSTYDYFSFKNHVVEVLENRFGSSNVKSGNKAIKIVGSGNRRDADVRACANFRKYRRYRITHRLRGGYLLLERPWPADRELSPTPFPELHHEAPGNLELVQADGAYP